MILSCSRVPSSLIAAAIACGICSAVAFRPAPALAISAAPQSAAAPAPAPAPTAIAIPEPAAATPPSQRTPLSAEDDDRALELTEPECAPDGAWVGYVVTGVDRDSDEARSAVWMVSWDGTQQLALTAPAAGTHAPHFSPDGRYLAFLTTPAGADNGVLMLLDRRGGDAQPLPNIEGDVSDFRWSPDGRRLVLVRQAAAAAAKSPRPVVIDALHFKQDEDGYLGTGRKHGLVLYDLEKRTLEPLTEDAEFDALEPAWSPDGRRIAFVRTREQGGDPDGREDIAIIDAAPGATAQVLLRPFAPNLQSLKWSPDGSALAFTTGAEPRWNAYMQDRLELLPSTGGTPRDLTGRLDRAVMSYAFAPDSASVLATIEDDASIYPVSIDLASGSIHRVGPNGGFVVSNPSAGRDHWALLYSDDSAVAEVHALEGDQLRKLTHHNDAWLATRELGAVADLRYKSKDGTPLHALVVHPPGYVAGRRYPTVLWIHGGPNGQDEHSLAFDSYEFKRQQLAAAGFVVVGVNYRGSSGRGAAFARAIFADWGHKEVQDLLAAIDRLVADGVSDPQRLGIGGWSYGGILTDYTIASDGRFLAAVSGAGSANQLSMYGSDQYILQYNAELGPPWRDSALWLKLSYPFFHADRIHTPTLFMGGDKDFNVPVGGGEQMYEALRTLGVPAELVVYPGEFHSLRRPSFVVDRSLRITAWFNRYLHAAPAPPAPP
jgi:dipeptidyl aminopeptidase/acylaminoacyl peptidase